MYINNVSFTGYDARSIKTLVARDAGLGEPFYKLLGEVADIGKKEGFDVIVQAAEKTVSSGYKDLAKEAKFPNLQYYAWCQDNLTFTPLKTILGSYPAAKANNDIAQNLEVPYDFQMHHIQGGNFFFIKEWKKDGLLIGKDELKYYSEATIRRNFGIDKIYKISQPDFHIDLGVRPLNNRRVLVNDPELTIKKIDSAVKNCQKELEKGPDAEVEKVMQNLFNLKQFYIYAMRNSEEYGNFDKIFKELKSNGFKPIKVPGSIIRPQMPDDITLDSHYLMNFINAIVHERPDKSLVYITNDSDIDRMLGITPEIEKKIGFSFKKAFIDSIKDYIDVNDIHFINADGLIQKNLERSTGGVHCVFAEQPNIN